MKVIDFGLSAVFTKADGTTTMSLETRAGTAYYIAPEVLDGTYDERCDVWSLGVLLYIMLTGIPPFFGTSDLEILENVKSMKYSLDIPEMQKVSEGA